MNMPVEQAAIAASTAAQIEPAHVELPPQEISQDVLLEKYAKGDEQTAEAVQRRVAGALAACERSDVAEKWANEFFHTLRRGFIPAGRINSAAGTTLSATLINCFVQPIGDAISETVNGVPGIYTALTHAAETMRRGGGVGYDFSLIRPAGSVVKSTQSHASGPISYMRVFDRSCETVESAGSRRGAQMGVLRCDHPDIERFIRAKDKGDLSNFNLSIGVTDAFMDAVQRDDMFELVHAAEPGQALIDEGAHRRADGLWVYRRVRALDLWDKVMRSTYDHAEPGILFLDRINADNNLNYCETIAACNPCVTDDTWVHTAEGPRQVRDLIGKPFLAMVDGKAYRTESEGFFFTGIKPVFKLSTVEGFSARMTADHQVRKVVRRTPNVIESAWVKAEELLPGDELVLHDHRACAQWAGSGTREEGYLLGLLLGDGTIKKDVAVLSIWAPELRMAANGGPAVEGWPSSARGIMQAASDAISTIPHRADFKGWSPAIIDGRGERRMQSAPLRDLANRFGMTIDAKTITPEIESASSDFYEGFLRGLFDADGCVQGTQDKGVSVRLSQSSEATLEAAQRMLLRLGVASTIYRNRRPAGLRPLPDGRGGVGEYDCKADHELVISGANLRGYADQVGFADTAKSEKLETHLGNYRRALNRERYIGKVASFEADGLTDESVYDVTVEGVHAFDANGLMVHNCGEQMLPPYGCCCLGSINLAKYVRHPFSQQATFDFDAFKVDVAVAVRALDNVLDLTQWPLPEQAAEAASKRRIGLGFLALGDATVMLGLPYDQQPARDFATQVSIAMRDEAYEASVELAVERGAFPLLDVEAYLSNGTFASRLPEHIKSRIRKHGIRNSHLLSIAPTGTIALAFADNASNGIEPAFSWSYTRKKRVAEGHIEYQVQDHAWRVYKAMFGADAPLTPAFVSALEMSAEAHCQMVAAVAPYIDSAISKTVNIPADYAYEDFAGVYSWAWRAKLKGISTYRPNNVLGSVLSVTPTETAPAPAADQDANDPDRRLTLKSLPQPALGSLRWPSRPTQSGGHPAWSFMVEAQGAKFAVFVSHTENGRPHPFEVWTGGAEQQRGLGAVAKTLSADMRADDLSWLAVKLEALRTVDDGRRMTFRLGDRDVVAASASSALAMVVELRLRQLGLGVRLEALEPSALRDALMSPKEPLVGVEGTLSWTVDVVNPGTGEDFTVFIKEALVDGAHRPYAVRLAGNYPRELDGLCRLLSIDMRVIDPAWIGMKLRKLLSYGEPMGDLFARVPGANKQQSYPSSVAYVAALVIHRYAQLGILDEFGFPVVQMGVLVRDGAAPASAVIESAAQAPQAATSHAAQRRAPALVGVTPGKQCPECGSHTLVKRDGCEVCTACHYMGRCG